VRLIFLGSPPFASAVLERLVRSPFRPECVLTQPPRARGRGRKVATSRVSEIAREEGIELIEPPTVRAEDVLARLRALEPDVFLVVSYGEILRPEFLAIPRVVSLNVHPSLLPRHRGATPVPAAILAGDTLTGVAIQRIVQELDAGDLLLLRETPIQPDETAGELLTRLSEWSAELVLEALTLVDSGAARYTPQRHEDATVCRKLKKEHGRINWSRPATELACLVRAMNPWPGAAARLSGHELQVWSARVHPDARGEAGTVLEADRRWLVATGDGALELLEVQVAGKRRMQAGDYLRGARVAPGDRLE
jgi:methionyl-tRNA formyltransferase